MSKEVEHEIGLLIRAGYQIVVVETFEESRALRVLGRAAETAECSLHTWSLAGGLDGNGEGAGSLDAGLRSWIEGEEAALLVVLDAHVVVADPVVLRRLRDPR